MPIIDCPKCRERMQVAAPDLGERVICPSCDHRFTAQDDARGEDRPRSRGRDDDNDRRPRSRGREDDFDRPPKKSNALLWVILGLLTIFIILPCLGCVGWFVYFGVSKADFPAAWTDHSIGATDGSSPATASFPTPPVTNLLNDPLNEGVGTTLSVDNIQQNQAMMDATFLIGHVDYPAGTENPLAIGYLPIRKAITDQHLNNNPLATPPVVSETATTVGGYPAKEARYAKEHGDYTLRIIHVNDRPKNGPARLVVVLAGGTGMKEEDKQKFLNSVRIGKGK